MEINNYTKSSRRSKMNLGFLPERNNLQSSSIFGLCVNVKIIKKVAALTDDLFSTF